METSHNQRCNWFRFGKSGVDPFTGIQHTTSELMRYSSGASSSVLFTSALYLCSHPAMHHAPAVLP